MSKTEIFDALIVGGGPGGCTAALYCARAGLSTLLLEKLSPGGQMALTEQIENYPGYDDGIDGFRLAERMLRSAERFGAKMLLAQANRFSLAQETKAVETSEGTIKARSVILAMGASHRTLGLEGEQALAGRGVHYCATCDAMRYRDKTVAVVGGGDSAVGDALVLSKLCRQVVLLHRGEKPKAQQAILTPLMQAQNVRIVASASVTALLGGDTLRGLQFTHEDTGKREELSCDGVFVAIGRTPNTQAVQGQIQCDENGYLSADETTKTNIAGVFAVGDLRTKAVRQIVTAAADGACAAHFAAQYIDRTRPA